MIEKEAAQGGERNTNNPKARDLICKKISINQLMELWDQGWGIAVHTRSDDESPYIITRKNDFFDIHAKLFECFHADDDTEDEKFMQVVMIE